MFAAKIPSRGLPFLERVDPIERSYGPEMTERGGQHAQSVTASYMATS